jgi:hypothetical protein
MPAHDLPQSANIRLSDSGGVAVAASTLNSRTERIQLFRSQIQNAELDTTLLIPAQPAPIKINVIK